MLELTKIEMVRNSKAFKNLLDLDKNCQERLRMDRSERSLLSQIISTGRAEKDCTSTSINQNMISTNANTSLSIISNIYNNNEDAGGNNKSIYAQQIQQSPTSSFRDTDLNTSNNNASGLNCNANNGGIASQSSKCNTRSRSMISADYLVSAGKQQTLPPQKTTRLNESSISQTQRSSSNLLRDVKPDNIVNIFNNRMKLNYDKENLYKQQTNQNLHADCSDNKPNKFFKTSASQVSLNRTLSISSNPAHSAKGKLPASELHN